MKTRKVKFLNTQGNSHNNISVLKAVCFISSITGPYEFLLYERINISNYYKHLINEHTNISPQDTSRPNRLCHQGHKTQSNDQMSSDQMSWAHTMRGINYLLLITSAIKTIVLLSVV